MASTQTPLALSTHEIIKLKINRNTSPWVPRVIKLRYFIKADRHILFINKLTTRRVYDGDILSLRRGNTV